MDKKLKAKWVKALRSGRYKQTTGMLEYGGANCCLGVLCRVARLKRRGGGYFIFDGDDDALELPGGYGEHVGISIHEQSELQAMNDGGKSFDEIARYISKNL